MTEPERELAGELQLGAGKRPRIPPVAMIRITVARLHASQAAWASALEDRDRWIREALDEGASISDVADAARMTEDEVRELVAKAGKV